MWGNIINLDCADGWHASDGECIKVSGSGDMKNWSDSKASCIQQGAKLAIVGTQVRARTIFIWKDIP